MLFTWLSFSLHTLQSQLPDISAMRLGTVGTDPRHLWHSHAAKSSLEGQSLWVWNATPKQHQFSCVLHREMLRSSSSTEILQINLYLMQKKYDYTDNAIISKARISFISPLCLKKLDSQNHKPKNYIHIQSIYKFNRYIHRKVKNEKVAFTLKNY